MTTSQTPLPAFLPSLRAFRWLGPSRRREVLLRRAIKAVDVGDLDTAKRHMFAIYGRNGRGMSPFGKFGLLGAFQHLSDGDAVLLRAALVNLKE